MECEYLAGGGATRLSPFFGVAAAKIAVSRPRLRVRSADLFSALDSVEEFTANGAHDDFHE